MVKNGYPSFSSDFSLAAGVRNKHPDFSDPLHDTLKENDEKRSGHIFHTDLISGTGLIMVSLCKMHLPEFQTAILWLRMQTKEAVQRAADGSFFSFTS